MATFRSLVAIPVLALVALTLATAGPPRGKQHGQEGPRPALSDPQDAPLPAGAIARLGTTRLRNGGGIYDFAFSPDGKLLATAGSGNNMRLWDAATGRLVHEFPEDKGRAHRLAFTPDGARLISTAGGRGLQVWVVVNRKEVSIFGDAKESITRIAVSPDSKTLATAHWGRDAAVSLWDLETGKKTVQLQGGPGGVEALDFSPNNRLLAVTGYHRGVEVWEVASGRLRQKFTRHTSQPSNALFTPDGKALVVNARLGIHVWDVVTEKQLRLFGTQKQIADGSLALSPEGNLVAAGDLEGAIHVWDWRTTKEVGTFRGGHLRSASRLVFSPDGKQLVSTGPAENRLFLWDVATGKLLHDPPGHRAEVVSVAVSADGNLVATGSSDRSIRLWDRASARELWRVSTGFNHPIGRVAFAPDSKTLAASTSQGQNLNYLALYDVASGKELRRFGKDLPGQRALAFAPDGKTLASGGAGKITFWDVASGRPLRAVQGTKPNFPLWDIAFSPDGTRLAIAQFNRQIGVLDVAAGKEFEVLGEHGGSTLAVAFTPDGGHVVSGGADSTARLWHAATKKEVQRFAGHGSHVYGVAVSPDARLLATASLDRLVRLWDLATGEELGCFEGHNAGVFAVAFSRDGKYLVSGSGDSTALVWEVRRMLEPAGEGVARLSEKERGGLWADLADADAERAFKATQRLLKSPADALALIRERLTPVKIRAEVARLLAELDSTTFATRERATVALEKLGVAAVPDLRRALERNPTGEVKARVTRILERLTKQPPGLDGNRLRALRCIEILETLGTPQARAVLEAVSREDPQSPTGQEARAALERLKRRPPRQ